MACVKDEWSSRTTLCDTGFLPVRIWVGRLLWSPNRIRVKDVAMLGTHRGG
jgi:hypothetical protein